MKERNFFQDVWTKKRDISFRPALRIIYEFVVIYVFYCIMLMTKIIILFRNTRIFVRLLEAY